MKQPYGKVPRFIELPRREKLLPDVHRRYHQGKSQPIFPGYDVDSSYCIKISRDADILIDDTASSADLVEQVKK